MDNNNSPEIKTNKIKCLSCNEIIESKTAHDFKRCKCGHVAVDGGKEYLRRIGTNFKELSEYNVQ